MYRTCMLLVRSTCTDRYDRTRFTCMYVDYMYWNIPCGFLVYWIYNIHRDF